MIKTPFEYEYLQLLNDAIMDGVVEQNRTGVPTHGTWGRQIHHDLTAGFPILTTRKISFRIAFEETMFFLRGETDTKKLEAKGINIWKQNTSRQFLDSRGLTGLPEGDMGKGYGFQMRRFDEKVRYYAGMDQVAYVMTELQKKSNSRRLILSTWNPNQLRETALPPCHILSHYRIREGEYLDSLLYQRSADLYHGVPYNIMGYAFVNHLFAHYAGLTPGRIVYTFGDAHVYETHLDAARELTRRTPTGCPILDFIRTPENFEDLQFDDVRLIGYHPHPPMKKIPMVE